MKYQILFSGKKEKNIINLSSAELAKRVVKFNFLLQVAGMEIVILIIVRA